jgi:hypothetical protein
MWSLEHLKPDGPEAFDQWTEYAQMLAAMAILAYATPGQIHIVKEPGGVGGGKWV